MKFSTRRTTGLVRAELRMLLRNKVSLFYALAMAPFMVLVMAELPVIKQLAEAMPRGGLATMLTTTLAVMGLTIAIYYNLTTAVVARRESLVLKRLRSGTCSTTEILTAIATPNVAIFAAQVVCVLVAVCLVFGAPDFTNPVLLVGGLALGAIFFAICSFLTGVSTRSVEAAQLSTMPGILAFMLASGMVLPMSMMPEWLQSVVRMLPVAPVADLVMLGLSGTGMDKQPHDFAGTWLAATQPTLVLVCWIAAGAWYLNRTMAWEPRR